MFINIKNKKIKKTNKNKIYLIKSGTVIEELTNGINHNQIQKMTLTNMKRNKKSKVLSKITNPTQFPIFKKINP